jgi:hypothetical protein
VKLIKRVKNIKIENIDAMVKTLISYKLRLDFCWIVLFLRQTSSSFGNWDPIKTSEKKKYIVFGKPSSERLV